jgi:putative Mn2+ efflux pump MntP
MSLFDVPQNSLIVALFFLPLSLLYFYLGFALFNGIRLRDIFKADFYKDIGVWRIAIAIGTGIALSNLTIGFMFSILSYPLAETMLIFGIALAVIMIILALIKNAREKHQFYKNIAVRCAIFIIIGVIFLLVHGQPGS